MITQATITKTVPEPVFSVRREPATGGASPDLDCRDVAAELVRVRAGAADVGGRCLLGVVEVFGAAQQPGGDVVDLRRCGLHGLGGPGGVLGA